MSPHEVHVTFGDVDGEGGKLTRGDDGDSQVGEDKVSVVFVGEDNREC